MWGFGVFRALGLLVRTLPFLVYRTAVCFGIALGLAVGAFLGAALVQITKSTGNDATAAVWGGLAGLVLTGGMVYLVRGRLRYSLKARYVALLVEALDRRPVPFSFRQFKVASAIVAERFQDASALSALDRLISGVVRAATRMVDGLLEGLFPVSVLDRLLRGLGLHLWLARPLIDGVVMAHAIRSRSENAWEAAHDGLVLYTQNARALMTAAVWLQLAGWVLAGLVLLAVLHPATILADLLPEVPGTALFLAAVLACTAKMALYDPFALACMVQLHLRLTDGQEPLGEWRGRLTQVSDKFRQLGEQALGWGARAAQD